MYKEKLSVVCDYITMNLEKDLSLDELSVVAKLSKYHFHRIFSVYVGISISSYVQLIRFKRASYQLVFDQDKKIIDIAYDAKFESHEAFSRAFKKRFKLSPSEFRDNPDWDRWHEHYQFIVPTKEVHMNVVIKEFKKINIAVLEHRASPSLLNDTIADFINWRKESKLSPVASSKTLGLAYDDPNAVEADDFRFDICGEVHGIVPENKYGVLSQEIPLLKCAVIRHLGPHEKMNEIICTLYREWLPTSGEKLRDYPLFFEYHNFLPEVSESELITDIYLPLI
jgi:AraC family transcriptional regulator